MAGIPRPASPGVTFDMSNLKVKELREFVGKAHTKNAQDRNGSSYKLYKNSPLVLGELMVHLRHAWKVDLVPQDWKLTDGVQIHQ